jgi:hypothetical protein
MTKHTIVIADTRHVFSGQTERTEMTTSASSFRFLDDEFNARLIRLLRDSPIRYVIDAEGVIQYPVAQEEEFEDVLFAVRSEIFPKWQVLSCPRDWVVRYKRYMTRRGIPFFEQLENRESSFLIPRAYRPHSWTIGRTAVDAK